MPATNLPLRRKVEPILRIKKRIFEKIPFQTYNPSPHRGWTSAGGRNGIGKKEGSMKPLHGRRLPHFREIKKKKG